MRPLFSILLSGPDRHPKGNRLQSVPASLEAKAQFLYASISDAQAIIRVVDTKISILVGLLVLPLAKADLIYKGVYKLFAAPQGAMVLYAEFYLLFFFVACWVMALLISLRALIGIDNPVRNVRDSSAAGVFYSGHLFSPNIIDSVLNRSLLSKDTFEQHFARIPDMLEDICRELSFELMKLSYIRSVKLCRQRYAFHSAVLSLIAAGLLFCIYVIVMFDF